MNKQSGFTIVELLVVIVVIGVLAAITIVSYSGISSQAIIASLQSDLANASKQFKLFQVEKGGYPTSISTNCSTQPDSNTNKCLKSSSDNSFELCPSGDSQKFSLIAKNSNLTYLVTNDKSPASVSSSNSIFPSNFGSVVDTSCTRTHTFGPGSYSISATSSGTIQVLIDGAGGGGGADYLEYSGPGSGGQSSLQINSNSPYVAFGGGSGDSWEEGGAGGDDGSTSPGGLTGSTGGGSYGGGGYDGGGGGGSGGRITGSITVSVGQVFSINVGYGGGGGCYVECGGDGDDGRVTISYSLYQ